MRRTVARGAQRDVFLFIPALTIDRQKSESMLPKGNRKNTCHLFVPSCCRKMLWRLVLSRASNLHSGVPSPSTPPPACPAGVWTEMAAFVSGRRLLRSAAQPFGAGTLREGRLSFRWPLSGSVKRANGAKQEH